MGQVGFGEAAFWLVAMCSTHRGRAQGLRGRAGRAGRPRADPQRDRRAANPHRGPESVQGALAAWGLLGGGSRYLGVTEDAGGFLAAALAEHEAAGQPLPDSDDGWDDLARTAVGAQQASGGRIPGLATRCTRPVTRAPRAHPDRRRGGPARPAPAAVRGRRRAHPELLGRTLPLNGAGVCGAALCDLGFAPDVLRGSPCSPGRPGSSGTSPRRCADRSARRSTTRSTGQPSTSRRPAADRRSPATAAALRRWDRAMPLDPEERVEEPVRDRHVAAHRAVVAPAERAQHHAGGVELEVRRQARDLARLVAEPVSTDRDPGRSPRRCAR